MGKSLSVNPLKTSPAMGAAIALQGIKGGFPLLHAAPGCTFLTKVVMTNHTREPMALLGTDIKEMSTIMGGWEAIEEKLLDMNKKQKPDLVGVISTALAHVRGEDVDGAIESARTKCEMPMIHIEAPDYKGSFAEGFATAILQIVKNFAKGGEKNTALINFIPAPYMTPADIEEINELIESFGFETVVLPDLAAAMDGSKDKFSAKAMDGTTLADVAEMGTALLTITVGKAVQESGAYLESEFGVEHFPLESLMGIKATDALVKILMEKSGKEPSRLLKRRRRRLADAMIDAHMALYGRKAAIGLDPDHTIGMLRFFAEVGVVPHTVILPISAKLPEDLKGADHAKVGDLGDLEIAIKRNAGEGLKTDIIITNSHGIEASSRTGVPLMRAGFPVYDRFGETLQVRVGYRGAANLVFELANTFMEQEHHQTPEKPTGHEVHAGHINKN